MGQVWLAMRPTMGGVSKPVAIKVLPIDPMAPGYEKAFLEEARISTLLSHSNIVQVLDVGTTGSVGYLVTEVVDGIDLTHLVRTLEAAGRRIPIHVAVYVVVQILRALKYAHTLRRRGEPLGIVHRDVSPHNVLVSVSGEVKLIDFGIARSMLDETKGLQIKGKLRYMAPEQFDGRRVDARADLYAVGAVLHELLSGVPLRRGQTPAELYVELGAREVPPLAGVPPEVESVRLWLLQPEPERRLASAVQAVDALQRWPGYVDASTELAALCCELTGVDGPRAELGALAEPTAVPSWDAATGGAPTLSATATAVTRTAAGEDAPMQATRQTGEGPSALVGRIVLVGVLSIVVAAVVGSTVWWINDARPPEDPLPVEPPTVDEQLVVGLPEPLRPDLTWVEGFCLVDVARETLGIAGLARKAGQVHFAIIDGETGKVLRLDPAPSVGGLLCLDPRTLVLQHLDGDNSDTSEALELIDVDGSSIARHRSVGPMLGAFFRTSQCVSFWSQSPPLHLRLPAAGSDDACQAGAHAPRSRLRQVIVGAVRPVLGPMPLDDGSWIWADEHQDELRVARIEPGQDVDPDGLGSPGELRARWRRTFDVAPQGLGNVLAASPDRVLALGLEGERPFRTFAYGLELDSGHVSFQAKIMDNGSMGVMAGYTGSVFVASLVGRPGLIAIDPADGTVRWRHAGVPAPQ